MPQNAEQPQEKGILARLSSTITIEDAWPRGIQIWRESDGTSFDCITLRPEVEDKLLAFLLARKGITLQG